MYLTDNLRGALKSLVWLHDANLNDLSEEATEPFLEQLYDRLDRLNRQEAAFAAEVSGDLRAIEGCERPVTNRKVIAYSVDGDIERGYYLRALDSMRVPPHFEDPRNHLRRATCYEKLGCFEVAKRFRLKHESLNENLDEL
jgi:hypothetical protein